MKKTGALLKKAREEKNLSLHEIGLSLKISNKVLKAIEEGDETQLPAKTFLRGFVQSYANFLQLDSNQILEVFYEEMGSTRPKPYLRHAENERPPSKEDLAAQEPAETPLKPKVNTDFDKKERVEAPVTPIKKTSSGSGRDGLQSLRENKSTRTIIISVIGIFLVALIIFTKKMIDKYSKEAEVPSGEVAQTIEGATPVTTDDNGATSDTPEPTIEDRDSSVTSQPPMTPIEPKISSTPSATVTPSPTPTPAPTATPIPSPTAKPEAGKPVELIVEALDAVEIEYSSPAGKPQKIKLSSEQVHTFKSRSGLKISISNGGAVNLIHNGKDLGIPGDLGQPIQLSY